MTDIRFSLLSDTCRPLLDKFYREHRSPMRAVSQGQRWVAKQSQIVGALCLTPVAHGHWLTGLFVAPPMRGQAIARRLISHALEPLAGPVWLFCHPDLLTFYQQSGFEPATDLPSPLADKFMRYSRSKPLIALIKL
ncbi:GNAT family N-acetyltransferase [Pseudomonas sp. NPDC089734]|uniref:GNAT family N-acetyltransferase n=1 Tax=Pseudomonas sp. NPDC089734 TaxID=3364469 RepID=UPI00381CAAF2